jgi:hypothetical protein
MTTPKIAYLPLLMGRIAKRVQNLTIFYCKWNNYLMNTLTIEIASKINCGILVEHIYLLWRERSTMCILNLWIVSSSWFPRKSLYHDPNGSQYKFAIFVQNRTGPVNPSALFKLPSWRYQWYQGISNPSRKWARLLTNAPIQTVRVVPIIIIKFLEMLRVSFS